MKCLFLTVTTIAALLSASISTAQHGSGDLAVYEDDLLAPWHHTTLNSSVTLVSTEQQHTGTSSMKVETTVPWGWVSMIHGPWNGAELDTAPYESVSFAIYPTERATSVGVFFENEDNQDFPKIAVGTFNANTWAVVSIPVSELNPEGYMIKRLFIQDFSGETKTYYIDNIRFVTEEREAPSTPSPVSPANNATGISQTPDIIWNAVNNTDEYTLQVAVDNDFNSLIINQSGISGTSYSIGQELNSNTTYYWRVRASNSAGAGDWSPVWIFTTAGADEPLITVLSPRQGEIIYGGDTYTITWENRNIETIRIQYSPDGGISWVEIASSVGAAAGQFHWEVPRQLSRQAVIRLSDNNNPQLYDLSATFGIYTSVFYLNEQYQFSNARTASNYRMIGIPGNTNIHLSDVLTGAEGEDWRAYHDSGGSDEFLIEYDGSDIFNFKPGRAFWIISRNAISFDQESETVPLGPANTYSIPLHSGWNIISNPFDISIHWEDIQAFNGLNDPLWSFEGSYDQSSRLDPYRGYYFFNRNNLNELIIPYLTDETATASLQAVAVAAGLTTIETTAGRSLSLSVYSDGEQQASVTAGSGIVDYDDDRLVHFAPPGDFADFSLSIVDEKNEFDYKWLAKDIRRSIGEGQKFPIQLSSPPGRKFEISVDGVDAFPEYEVMLIDKRNANNYNLREMRTLQFSNEHSQYHFMLVIGTTSFIENAHSSLIPDQYDLLQNYPNPFNPVTVIRYQLPVSSEVRLEIFDLLGRRVSTLVNEHKAAGRYTVTFDGTRLASGVYMYRIQAGNFVELRWMTLVK